MDTPVKETNAVPVDLLGRQEIVDRIMKILEVISEKKSSCTFALNGAWGTGKTFVLNMLMNQLWEYHSDKYIVFHYNCWQYDYYEEPLIAIVAAMLDSVDKENHLLPTHLRDKAKAGMELAKPFLHKIATDFVKNKIGVDLTDVVSSVKGYQKALDSEEQKKADERVFDGFYSFKKAIQQAQEQIRNLAKDRTLVVVVDELDRCLPSYAIKVLERLHHLFTDIRNSTIIFAVDKSQLNQTISQIFGTKTNTTKYLHKFINFELQLDNGNIDVDFEEKYQDYFSQFDMSLLDAVFPYEDYIHALFSDIAMRDQERLMERITTIHTLLFGGSKKDYSFMCFELTWAIFHEKFNGCELSNILTCRDSGKEYATLVGSNGKFDKKLTSVIDTLWSTQYFSILPDFSPPYRYLDGNETAYVQMALLIYISSLTSYGPKYAVIQSSRKPDLYKILDRNTLELEQFVNLFSIIR